MEVFTRLLLISFSFKAPNKELGSMGTFLRFHGDKEYNVDSGLVLVVPSFPIESECLTSRKLSPT